MSKARGKMAEKFVAQYLEKEGFTILAENYACHLGEVDLIGLKKDTLIFVEVKQRTKSYFDLSELITVSKQKKIVATAKYFLLHNEHSNKTCRFDAALLEGALPTPKLTYIPNAFIEHEGNV